VATVKNYNFVDHQIPQKLSHCKLIQQRACFKISRLLITVN